MARGKYQLSTTRDGVEVFRRGFGNRDEACQAVADALVRHRDCEVRLIEGEVVLLSAGPVPATRLSSSLR